MAPKSNFADDNTLHKCASSLDEVVEALIHDLDIILAWFRHNSLVANPEKFQVFFPGTKNASIEMDVGNILLKSSENVKLLGVSIDSSLTFYPHVQDICNKAAQKTKTILRFRSYLNQEQADFLVNSFILSAFKYCPLIWMFCSKLAHNLLRETHCRALRAKLNSFNLNYNELLKNAKCESIHTQNLQLMLVEVYKSVNNIGNKLGHNQFEFIQNATDEAENENEDENSNKRPQLRRGAQIKLPHPKNTVCLNSFDFRAGQAWNRLPLEYKNIDSLEEFKNEIAKAKIYCSCKLCSIF